MQTSSYLGTEKTGKLLVKFAVPCIFSLIISCLYNIVDQIFVGNGVGYLGNAATGVIFPITVSLTPSRKSRRLAGTSTASPLHSAGLAPDGAYSQGQEAEKYGKGYTKIADGTYSTV